MEYVVITGCSTGIGLAVADLLAKSDFKVLAGVRKPNDQQKLEQMHPNIRSFILDVAYSDSQAKAFKEIEAELSKAERVHLINNAGISVPGPIEGLRIEDLHEQLNVNFFGLVEWTQYLLPRIRETKGKIINISSVSGLVSSPFLGAYSASKYAVEAVSDALRREVRRFGVEVILIEPGPVSTPIWAKGLEKKERMSTILRPGMSELYSQEISRMVARIELATQHALPVEKVAETIKKCLLHNNNPVRILMGTPGIKFQVRMARWLPTKLADRLMAKFFYK